MLRGLDLVRLSDRLLSAAGVLAPSELRALDAIHLATAAELGRQLTSLVTYDERMAAAGKRLGYTIIQPR